MAAALLIVDMQYDFCEGGSLAVPDGNSIIPLINILRENPKFSKIYRSLDWHPENHISFQVNNPGSTLFQPFHIEATGVDQMMWPVHCVQDSHGSQTHADVVTKPTDTVVKKGQDPLWDSYSAFGCEANRTYFEDTLRNDGITELYLCGLALDYCVGVSATDAVKHGFTTYVIRDATKPVTQETGEKMIVQFSENNVNLINSDEIN